MTAVQPGAAAAPDSPTVLPFVPPPGELAEAPGSRVWYGTAALYVALPPDGEAWRGLPHNPDGYTQKTVWWSINWRPDFELQPAITVSGVRLDGPGTFEFGPGTNASAPISGAR